MREYNFTIYDETYKDEIIEPGRWPLWKEHHLHYQRGGTSEEWQELHRLCVWLIVTDQGFEFAREEAIAGFENEFNRKVGHIVFNFEMEREGRV